MVVVMICMGSGNAAGIPADDQGTITFLESVPAETTLDLPELHDAQSAWITMIDGTQQTLDIVSFYFSASPDGAGRLEPVLQAVIRAARRGVRVRMLSDLGFDRTYPGVSRRMDRVDGISVRLLDGKRHWGGVLHAKGFVIDSNMVFVGSQNWDWRALTHIHEFGVAIEHPALAVAFGDVFELDWSLADPPGEAGGTTDDDPIRQAAPATPARHPEDGDRRAAPEYHTVQTTDGMIIEACLAASPPNGLPAGIAWDEPLLVEMIDSAQDTLRLQLLSYNPGDREGGFYTRLDSALRRAAARGVQVRIILSNWAKRHYMLPHIQSLAVLPNIEIRFTNIPEHSGGFIPYARVEHAKYLTVDRHRCWIGTANWARNYFHNSRNISILLRGVGSTSAADRYFDRSWYSEYAEIVNPCQQYEPPRYKH